jgi:signal transduction histidine kinase/DNA-binding response OmpR family regulator
MLQDSQVTFQSDLLSQPILHLLIVEDVTADVELMTLTLEMAGITFTYDLADTVSACQDYLRSQTYNAMLSDYRLPNLNGLQALRLLQESGQDIPFILVTGSLGEEAAVECIKAGMTDYVLKERLFRLPMVLARALQEFDLRHEKEIAQRQIHRQAWREATINRIVQSMRGTLVLDEVLQRTANHLYDALQVSYCLICQPETDHPTSVYHISETSDEGQRLMEVSYEFERLYQERLVRGESVVLDRIHSNVTPELQQAAQECGIRSLMIAPLLYQQSYLGEITLYQCDQEREWTSDELALVAAIADHCAIALHQAQLYQQVQIELAERKRLEGVLRHQAEELAQANRLKDEFLAIVSHELRTPLSTILAWSQFLRLRKQKLDEATVKKAMSSIERSAKAQVKIVDDILDVSRMIRGQIRLNIDPVNLVPVIEAVVEDMRPMAEAKKIQIEVALERSVGLVAGDKDRLQQVVRNLLSNAIKFTPDRGQVRIRLGRVGNRVQIQVSDTGIGIHPDFLPHVFDRFRQADSTNSRTYGGLGLGLAIVHHLVGLHGGSVHAASEGKGKGAIFTVQLPLQTDGLETDLDASSLRRHFSMRRLDGVRVLVVDDDVHTCEALTAVLEQYGAQVIAVTSATAGVGGVTDWKPDILISDIGMPNRDGYWLLDQVRGLAPEQGGRTPAIALTAFARDEDRERSLEAGFQMYLSKPVELDKLIAGIAHLVQRNQPTPDCASPNC